MCENFEGVNDLIIGASETFLKRMNKMRRLEDIEENLLVKDNYSHQKSQIRTGPKGKRKTSVVIKAKERRDSAKEGLFNCITFFKSLLILEWTLYAYSIKFKR